MKPLILIIGASGSGKTTLCEEMNKRYGLKQIPSYTTRPMRTPDEVGHIFVNQVGFDSVRNDLIAYAKTEGYEYGVTKALLECEAYSFYVIDNTGVKYLRENYHGERPFISVFIDCPLSTRYERMRKRGNNTKESLEHALNRIVHDAIEFKDVKSDYILANNDGMLSNAITKLTSICIDNDIIETIG